MKRKTFFEKLADSMGKDNNDEFEANIIEEVEYLEEDDIEETKGEDDVGELSIDMYRIDNAIVIKAMIAGIQKDEIDISVSRDNVILRGARYDQPEGEIDESFFKELYWGKFEREIELPDEIDIELAEANEEHGLLTLILPLVDKHRKTKLSVK